MARIDDDDVWLPRFEVPALLGEIVAERAEVGTGELPVESRGPGAVPRRVRREIDAGELTHGPRASLLHFVQLGRVFLGPVPDLVNYALGSYAPSTADAH